MPPECLPTLADPPDDPRTHDQCIEDAIVWLREDKKRSIRAAGRLFSVSESTLRGQLNGAQTRSIEMASRRLLSKQETAEIASHARLMQSLHFPLTPRDIQVEAERVLHARSEAACKANKTLGPDWYTKVFLEDNPEMRSKRGKVYDRARAISASHNQLKDWYADVRTISLKAQKPL